MKLDLKNTEQKVKQEKKELAKLSKVKNVSLEVRESNERAINLYTSFGFKFSHKRERYYKDQENIF
mgnify:CR=1 FL=1